MGNKNQRGIIKNADFPVGIFLSFIPSVTNVTVHLYLLSEFCIGN